MRNKRKKDNCNTLALTFKKRQLYFLRRLELKVLAAQRRRPLLLTRALFLGSTVDLFSSPIGLKYAMTAFNSKRRCEKLVRLFTLSKIRRMWSFPPVLSQKTSK